MEELTNRDFLKQLLENLKQPIPHKWRVQSFSKNKPKATVMAYIDARDAQNVLDTYCEYGWHREHVEVSGKIYCKVGIVMPDGTIQWRSDCGVESQSDAEKGQSSDSFKRACVNFGIGRFLYDLPIQYVDADAIKGKADTEDKKYKVYPNAIDEQGRKIWDMTAYINNRKLPVEPEVKKPLSIHEHTENLNAITDLKGLVKYYNALTEQEKASKELTTAFSKRRQEVSKTNKIAA